MNIKTFFLAFAVVAFAACSNNPFSKEIEQVEALETDLSVAQAKIDSIDFDNLTELSTKASEQLSYIQKNYRDTLSKDLASMLGFYKSTYRNMQKLMNRVRKTDEELQNSKTQLNNLKADLSNQLIPADSVSFYIKEEAEVAQEIKNATNEWPAAQARYISNYDDLYPRIDSILQEMNKNGIR